MYRIIVIKHRRNLDGLANNRGSDGNSDADLFAAEIATNAVVANLDRAKSSDFVAYMWGGRIWAMGRVVGAYRPYGEDPRYVRVLSDPSDVPVGIRNVLEGSTIFVNGNHTVRYGLVDGRGLYLDNYKVFTNHPRCEVCSGFVDDTPHRCSVRTGGRDG